MLEISDKDIGKLIYKGEDVGKYEVKDGLCHLQLDIQDVFVVLAPLSAALRKSHPAPPKSDYVFTSSDDDVETVDGFQTLNEKHIKAAGEVQDFHKTDKDPQPSTLHGHSGRRKLDAITGKIYDVNTRQMVGKLKKKPLVRLQSERRDHKDFPVTSSHLPRVTKTKKINEALEENDQSSDII